MILGFKSKFPWGENTNFVDKVLASMPSEWEFHWLYEDFIPKIHTIREGQRWKAGQWLHMATGVRTPLYNQFNKGLIELSKCRATQRFDLTFRNRDVVALYIDKKLKYCKNREHVYECEPGWLDRFAKNDGFRDAEQFFRWFNKSVRNGQIIHWTDNRY